jgi:hypothetical protein
MRVIYFLHNPNNEPAAPLDRGTALFGRVIKDNGGVVDYLWNVIDQVWVENETLIYYTAAGSPDLDNVNEADLPAVVTPLR